MNIEAVNNWPLMVVSLPKEKVLQNEFTAPASPKNLTAQTTLNNVSEIKSNEFWAKGSFVDIYI